MILVTGSTGQLGRLVIKHLVERTDASQIVAGARDLEKAQIFANTGISVRELDYDRPETIAPAFEGVTRVLLISGSDMASRVAHHKRLVDAAKEAGVEQLVYTSILNLAPEQMALAEAHAATEQYIHDSGVPFTVLRNGWYNENWAMGLGAAIEHGALLGSTGEGVVTPAARDDFAEAAAVVLTGAGHVGKTYELGGDTGYTSEQIAAVIAEVSGKPVVYQDLPEEQYAKVLTEVGLPEPFAQVLANSDTGIRNGLLEDKTGDLTRLIGRSTTPLSATFRAALS